MEETLKFGSKGDSVKSLQNYLSLWGLYPFAQDGDFGMGTYRAVVAFQQKVGVTADGIVGKTTWQKLKEFPSPQDESLYKAEDVVRVLKNKGYVVREDENRINMVGIRKDNFFDNGFTDTLVVFWKNKGVWQIRQFKWTTMAGTLGQGAFNPITVLGLKGTAVLKEGQYLNTWTFIDSYTGWLFYPYFWQTKPVTVYRDGNGNSEFELTNPTQEGLFGINIHRMSNNGVDSNVVNTVDASWSIGCQGAPEPTFAKIVELARITAGIYGNVFDYTLINSKELS